MTSRCICCNEKIEEGLSMCESCRNYMKGEDWSKKNQSGCFDPTAYIALKTINDEYGRFKKVLDSIFDICNGHDFEIIGRVVLRDKKTGKEWR